MNHKNDLRAIALAILGLAGWSCWGQEAASDPWASGELLQPADLAQGDSIGESAGQAPVILSVAFPVLYKRQAHCARHQCRSHVEAGRDRSAEEGRGKAAEGRRPGHLLRLLPDGEVSQHPARLPHA